MSARYLSRHTDGKLYLSSSIDNKLCKLHIPDDLTADILYSYYVMSDEDFKKLCKFQNRFK